MNIINKQNLSSFFSLLLAVSILLTAFFSSACSSGSESVAEESSDMATEATTQETSSNNEIIIPDPEDVESVKIAVEINWRGINESFKNMENYDEVKDSGISAIILYEIKDDSDMLKKAVEINKKLDEEEDLSKNYLHDTICYKCEYTMKDGSKICNSIEKAIADEIGVLGGFLDEIDEYAVKLLTSQKFRSDDWMN